MNSLGICVIFSCCLFVLTQAAWEKAHIREAITKCNATDKDAEVLLTKFSAPDTPSGKCLMLCVLNFYNMIDSLGKYDEAAGFARLRERWSEIDEAEVRAVNSNCVAFGKTIPDASACEYGYQIMKCLIQEVTGAKFYEKSKIKLAEKNATTTSN